MAKDKVRAQYWLDAEQRDRIRDQAAAAGIAASEFIDMLSQLWLQLETGRVVMHQLPAASPFLARLQQISCPPPRSAPADEEIDLSVHHLITAFGPPPG